jgi:hypothetical protein
MKRALAVVEDELCKVAKILRDCGKYELIFRAAWAAQPKST